MWVDFDLRGQQGMDFFTGGSVILNDGLKMIVQFKCLNDGFVSYKLAAFDW